MQKPAKTLLAGDRTKLYEYLKANSDTPAGARLHAIVALAHSAALQLEEALGLRMSAVIDAQARARWTVSAPSFVIEGRLVPVPLTARPALQNWVRVAAREYKIPWPPSRMLPLFTQQRGLIGSRTVQDQFSKAQRAAGLARHYRFADLRHDALMSFGHRVNDPELLKLFGRLSDFRQVARYLPARTATTAELAQLGERSP